jgi:hypothetical protein
MAAGHIEEDAKLSSRPDLAALTRWVTRPFGTLDRI